MAHVKRRPTWVLPEQDVTSASVFLGRREFLQRLTASAGALAAARAVPILGPNLRGIDASPERSGVALTDATVAAAHGHFIEFGLDPVRREAALARCPLPPPTIRVSGLVERPLVADVADLVTRFGEEERIYRFRCVEGWSMVLPWSGFSLRRLLAAAAPWSTARFVAVRAHGLSSGGVSVPSLPFTEFLRLDEAMHPLTWLATRIYGTPLSLRHGAPLRLVVPWQYAFKSVKAVSHLELVATPPSSYWATRFPLLYSGVANVDPHAPRLAWSQTHERDVGTSRLVPTRPFNGYGDAVAALYA